jgi:hypothetical protein
MHFFIPTLTDGSFLATTSVVSFSDSNQNDKCPPFGELCEVSGNCLAVDVADRPRKLRYPLLVTAKASVAKLKRLNKTLLREKHLRIRSIHMFLHGCGFFTFPLMAMNQLWLAHEYGLIGDKKPIVYMPENHHYFSNSTTENPNCQTDFWETWFEPVHPTTSWHSVKEEDVWEFTQHSIQCAYYDANGIHAYPYYKGDSGTLQWIETHRQRAHAMIQQYIRIRPEIRQEAIELFQRLFGSTTSVLGIHMRGTDKRVNRKVDLEEYEIHADRFLDQHGKGKIFLATDDPLYHEHMHQKYQDRVVSLPQVTRLSWNVLYSNETDKTLKSKEALIDMLLLSHTTSLVKCWSAVSEFAVYVKRARGINFQHVFDLQLNTKKDSNQGGVAVERQSMSIFNAIDIASTNMTRFSDQVLSFKKYLPETFEQGRHELDVRLLAQLDLLAFNNTCRINQHQTITLIPLEFGFGAALHSLVKPVLHALKHGYCLNEPIRFPKYNCSWQDLFLPLEQPSGISRIDPLPLPARVKRGDESRFCMQIFNKEVRYNNEGRPGKFDRKAYRDCMGLYSYPKLGLRALPEEFQRMGLFAVVSTILHRLLRPSTGLKDRISSEKLAMNWPEGPVLGIHYRAGDSCLEKETSLGRKCDSFDLYMKEANVMRQKYNLTHIYLATDSSELLEAPLEASYPGWTFLYMKGYKRDRKRDLETVDVLIKSGRIDGCDEAHRSLMDIILLSETEAFIGKFSGNIDRVAYSLLYARNGQHRPYISLDNAWCFDFGVRSRPSTGNGSSPLLYYC